MATNPKMKPCPLCDEPDALAVYKYDSGWQYVECDGDGGRCWYRGPGEGSTRAAIKSHNAKREERRAAYLVSLSKAGG